MKVIMSEQKMNSLEKWLKQKLESAYLNHDNERVSKIKNIWYNSDATALVSPAIKDRLWQVYASRAYTRSRNIDYSFYYDV